MTDDPMRQWHVHALLGSVALLLSTAEIETMAKMLRPRVAVISSGTRSIWAIKATLPR